MPRKRKVAGKLAESNQREIEFPKKTQHPIFVVIQNAQINEAFHVKYIKELHNIYKTIGHEEFTTYFIKSMEHFMQLPPESDYANITLRFMAKYVTSINDKDDAHPILVATFDWILKRLSMNIIVRFRLCEFVNLILNSLGTDAALDDSICDNILKYMFDRLKDSSPMVRVQAVYALQRLQMPDNPNDPIVKVYQFYLSSDPSSNVRQAVITSIGRNFHTIPIIMERFWDIDEKVRRHAYLQMSSYPVKAYKVVQRLTFLEQGLTDQSDKVKKVVRNVLLPQWFESYNKDFVSFVSCLKLDSNTTDMDRFRKAAKLAVMELFKSQNDKQLIDALQLEEEGEFKTCIPLDKLTIESSLFWSSLIEYFQENDEKCEQADLIIPELSTFCNYISKYCSGVVKDGLEKWKTINYQYILRTLTDILLTFDLGDEIGRQNLKQCFINMMSNEEIEEKTVENIVRCSETLIPLTTDRMQFFIDIIRDVVNINRDIDLFNDSISSILDKDQDLKVKVTSIKLKIMELKEQKSELIQRNEYEKTATISEEINGCNEEIINLIKTAVSVSGIGSSSSNISSLLNVKKVTNEKIIRCLQMAFFGVCSRAVQSLTPNMVQLYKDFIRPQIESTQWLIRDWALKCGGSFSLLYSQLAKDTYKELYAQFFKHQNSKIWTTAITATFQLIDRYGFTFFDENEGEAHKNKSKKTRQLFNTMEYVDADEDNILGTESGIDVMHLFDHFLDTCVDVNIVSALVDGFGRLILRGHYQSKDMVSKLLLKYFNPMTDPLTNQILGIFLETLMKTRKQECLQPALLPTLFVILEAPNESPLKEVKPLTVLRFVINSTIPPCSSPGLNIHNTMAMSFLEVMIDNPTNKDLLRLLSSVFDLLEISDDTSLRNDIKTGLDKLAEFPLDTKTLENIKKFKISLVDKAATTFSSSAETSRRNTDFQNEDEHCNPADNENIQNIENNENEENNENNENDEHDNDDQEENGYKEQENDSIAGESIQQTDNIPLIQPDVAVTEEIPTNKSVLSTPTTYGLDNSTRARNLRKSLHIRQNISDSESSPTKVRATNTSKNVQNHNDEAGERNRKSNQIAKQMEKDKNSEANDSECGSGSDEEEENTSEASKSASLNRTDEMSFNDASPVSREIIRRIIPPTPETPNTSGTQHGSSLNMSDDVILSTPPENVSSNKKTPLKNPRAATKIMDRQERVQRSSGRILRNKNILIEKTSKKTSAKKSADLSSSSKKSVSTDQPSRAIRSLRNSVNVSISKLTPNKTLSSKRKNNEPTKTPTAIQKSNNNPQTLQYSSSSEESDVPRSKATLVRQSKRNTQSKDATKMTLASERKSRSIETKRHSKRDLRTKSNAKSEVKTKKMDKMKQIIRNGKGTIQKSKKINPNKIVNKISAADGNHKYGTRKAAVETFLQNTILTRRTLGTTANPIVTVVNKIRKTISNLETTKNSGTSKVIPTGNVYSTPIITRKSLPNQARSKSTPSGSGLIQQSASAGPKLRKNLKEKLNNTEKETSSKTIPVNKRSLRSSTGRPKRNITKK